MSKEMIRQWVNKWNSFNPVKALVHVPYWKAMIAEKRIAPPLTVSVDPCGRCCLNCPHCNAAKVTTGEMMTREMMEELVGLLKEWKTLSVCVGGGGESLINPETPYLLHLLNEAKIEAAVITNGLFLNTLPPDTLRNLKYLGVSMDAATAETWAKVKGVSSHLFDKVIENLCVIRKACPELDFTYKYLALPTNYTEVYEAAKLAKRLSCTNFHLRPGGAPWFEGDKSYGYTAAIRESVGEQLDRARHDFECDDFHVFGVVSKFNDNWGVASPPKMCWAMAVTCTVSPSGLIGLCCDRRGDEKVSLCSLSDVRKEWGGDRHRELMKNINLDACPRCTYSHVNEIFENFVIRDTTFCNLY